jgi:hypothetical protein
MTKLRILFIVSLGILGVLLALTLFHPLGGGGKTSEVVQESLLRTENEWIAEFNIINPQESEQLYTITVTMDGMQYNENVLIHAGKTFTYIHHIYPDRLTEGCVTISICKEGESTPVECITYYVK